ncbi:MAG: D-alanyl-D-alanine carboxypeptidase [Oscillospiraceae bacterium]|nr:D-alanyl-D-alanine carboxypeptidase [Oscillospiraceae bacterium]
MKKFISILAVMAVLFTFAVPLSPVSVQALSFRPTFQLKSESGILYHMDTQTVVFEKNADKQCSPAQTVQIMTAAIAIEKAQSMEAIIEIPPNVYNEFEKYRSRYPAEQFPYNEVTTSYLEEGEQFRVQDLISAMLLESSCEAAYALAYVIGEGSIQNFVNMMNEKAESLGAASTHFTNPHGLYDESQYTTARDMLKITEYALGLPGFAELSAAEQVKTGATNINPEGYEFNNVNLMMNSTSEYYYKGTKGIKTGNSNQSLRCLVTRASRDGQNYLAVLFGAPFDKDEYDDDIYTHLNDAAELFEWAFTNLEHKVVLEENQEIGSPKIKYAKGKDYINLKPANDVKCMWLATVDTSNIITDIDYLYDEVCAPVEAGEKLGTLRLRYLDNEIGTVDLVAYGDAEFSYSKYISDVFVTYWKSPAFKTAMRIATALSILYVAFVFYLFNLRVKRRRESKNSSRN